MHIITDCVIAGFTVPMRIGVNPQSVLWLLPLVASISIVYKATKIPKIQAFNFLKEVIILFASIIVFMFVTAVVLYVLAWLITE